MVQVVTTLTVTPILPVRIFLSSPGDLFPVRDEVKRLIEELNRNPRYENRYKFILYAYEDRVPPIIAVEPQRSVDVYNLRPDAPDIFVCLLWKRLGTPTAGLTDPTTGQEYPSGTVYELLTAYKATIEHQTPVILLYRCIAPVEDPSVQTLEQGQALDRFLTRFQSGGDLTGLTSATFSNASDLVNQLRDGLTRVFEVTLRERLDASLRKMLEPRKRALILPANLPNDYVERSAVLGDLRRMVLGTQRRVGVVAVQGQGGLGKTVLAKALCFDPATVGAFPDGVLWAELGQNPDVLATQRRWIAQLGGDPAAATAPSEGTSLLQGLLQDRAVLLVLDDVWQRDVAEALHVGGPNCRLLMTTRDAQAARGAYLLELDVMRREESLQLLRSAGGGRLDDATANEVSDRLGDLPLALDLVGGQLRLGVSWITIRQRLDQHDIRYLGLEQGEVYSAIASSVAALPDGMSHRLHELAIFPSDESLDRSAVAHLWSYTARFDNAQTEQTFAVLRARALIQPGDTFHDLVRDYLQLQFSDSPQRLRELHGDLVRSYGGLEGSLTLPSEENYAWRRLPWHLVEAGMLAEARTLVSDGRYLTRKISLVGTWAAAEDADLAAQGDEGFLWLGAGLRDSRFILDHDVSQLENQLFGRLGPRLALHDAPRPEVGLQLAWPSLEPTSLGDPSTLMLQRVMVRSASSPPAVRGCSFNSDGTLLATGSDDGKVRLWEVSTGTGVRTLEGHLGPVQGVAFSPDGSVLATVSLDETTRLWEVATGTQVRKLAGHWRSVWRIGMNDCTFSPDGTLLATASDDAPDDHSAVQLWEVGRGRLLRVLRGGYRFSVYRCAFSPDGQLLAAAGKDHSVMSNGGVVRLWEVSSGILLLSLNTYVPSMNDCAFSPDGTLLAAVGGHSGWLWRIRLEVQPRPGFWREFFGEPRASVAVEATKVERLETPKTPETRLSGRLTGCVFSPDGALLVTVGESYTTGVFSDWRARLWEVSSGKEMAHATLGDAGVLVKGRIAVAGHPNALLFAAGDWDGHTHLMRVNFRSRAE